MNKEEAMQHGLGYAAGREDASGKATAGSTIERSGFAVFAEAYAEAWDEYRNGRRSMMTNARDAYDTWQLTGGETIFKDYHQGLPTELADHAAGYLYMLREMISAWEDERSDGSKHTRKSLVKRLDSIRDEFRTWDDITTMDAR